MNRLRKSAVWVMLYILSHIIVVFRYGYVQVLKDCSITVVIISLIVVVFFIVMWLMVYMICTIR